MIDKPLEIVGDWESGEVIIEAPWEPAITFQANRGRIANLTLRRVDGEDFCVDIAQGHLELEECDISGGKSVVEIRDDTEATLRRNRIHGGEWGIWVSGSGMIEDNEIAENSNAGVLIGNGGNLTLGRNRIWKNHFGVHIFQLGQGFFYDNDVRGNKHSNWEIDPGALPNIERSGNKE